MLWNILIITIGVFILKATKRASVAAASYLVIYLVIWIFSQIHWSRMLVNGAVFFAFAAVLFWLLKQFEGRPVLYWIVLIAAIVFHDVVVLEFINGIH